MKFCVSRVSTMRSDEPPCDGVSRCPDGEYMIELNDLEALRAFVDKQGSVIISHGSDPDEPCWLEIYDYYIE